MDKETLVLVGFVFAVLIAVATAVVLVCIFFEQKRKKDLAWVAGEIGFKFLSKDAETDEQFSFLSENPPEWLFFSSKVQISNIFIGKIKNIPVRIFDFLRLSGEADAQKVTCVACQIQRRDFPSFCLICRSGLLALLNVKFDKQIEFYSQKEFSKKYIVQGNDENTVRALFSDSAIDFFKTHDNLAVFSNGQWLVIQENRGIIKGSLVSANKNAIKKILDNGFELARLFKVAAE